MIWALGTNYHILNFSSYQNRCTIYGLTTETQNIIKNPKFTN
jgi:hypothetical protein